MKSSRSDVREQHQTTKAQGIRLALLSDTILAKPELAASQPYFLADASHISMKR